MEVWIESKKITEGLYGDNRPGNSVLFRYGFLEDFLQGFPAATTQLREQLSVIEKISAKDFGYTENEMTVGYCLKDFFTEPLPEFNYPLLVTGGTKKPSFA